jgi:copper transport protein
MRLLTSVVARFSAMAGIAIAVILLTGVAQAIVYVESPKHLLDTAFGRAVLIKSVLFVLICALGFVNRNRILPRLRAAQEFAAGAGALLRRTLRLELAIGVAVIAVTGALAGYPPSTAQSSGPYSGSAVIGPARVEVTIDPARTGANEMHLYLFDRRSGAQWDRADEVTVRAQLPGKGIEPIAMPTEKAGPGHYVVSGATFGVAGDWKVEIGARVGEFDLYAATLGVPVE